MSITIGQSVLYGVTVTRESFYIGIRLVSMKALSQVVVDKVAPASFSGEIVALIADELTSLKEQAARAVWKPDFSNAKFGRYASPSPFEIQLLNNQIDPLGIRVIRVYDTPSVDGKIRDMLHLCVKKRLPISWESPASSTTVEGQKGCTRANNAEGPALMIAMLAYTPHPIRPALHGPVVNPAPNIQAARFFHLDDVEAAMQNWNAVNLEIFVKRFHLEIVGGDPANPLKPKLRVWTRILH